jgi:hypothetical protein
MPQISAHIPVSACIGGMGSTQVMIAIPTVKAAK